MDSVTLQGVKAPSQEGYTPEIHTRSSTTRASMRIGLSNLNAEGVTPEIGPRLAAQRDAPRVSGPPLSEAKRQELALGDWW